MRVVIDIDTIFALDREQPPAERSLPWEDNCNGLAVVVEPKPHWANDLLVYKLTSREYCCYRDWTENGSAARFIGHVDTTGDDVMMKARGMIAREIADGLWC
ncbi:hypothetical protein HW571_08405 [Agrobacterium genomosp. 3]|uniref:Uncharacterized protein n=2 Tax=Hyphomicrobiales TaxID=356 RepID=A0AA50CPT1_9HYPH|nr:MULTISPECIES: hypothetical protein [Hyphomicrobiales]MBX8800211.1 hypothetical protein [Ochrobactrum sp. MR28]MBX8815823.1 hypothetical protein [Ochrobactrum sp. MR31]MCA1865692.1 hypothetical protein [Agrobacterium tomkonis]MCA1876044.1 hypothetical protein [Agrobacterium tumefaciens]PZU79262.1 MAG: hypothetical protein DI546_01065 [Rhizobium sp.]